VGFVPQGRCNFPLMTVRENLELGAYMLPGAAGRAAIERTVATYPLLAEKSTVLAGNLSGGEQQILEMAMVLMTEPKLLLLDEPSIGLSPANVRVVFDAVVRIRDAGVTVLMVEQNVKAALEIADVAIVMELGRKFTEGPAREVARDPRIAAAYLGASAAEVPA
jgi:branched-chain amino acid transport system ATP-binding protein